MATETNFLLVPGYTDDWQMVAKAIKRLLPGTRVYEQDIIRARHSLGKATARTATFVDIFEELKPAELGGRREPAEYMAMIKWARRELMPGGVKPIFVHACRRPTWSTDVDIFSAQEKKLLDVMFTIQVGLGTKALHGSMGHLLREIETDWLEHPFSSLSRADFYSCFISYSSKDRRFAQRLHEQLQRKGIRVWLDQHQVLPGDDIMDQIDRGIRVYDKVLLCCSKNSLSSPWVEEEIAKAKQKERELWKARERKTLALIPLDLDGYVFDGWESAMQSEVVRRSVADFKGWEDDATFDVGFEKLVKALRVDSFMWDPARGSEL